MKVDISFNFKSKDEYKELLIVLTQFKFITAELREQVFQEIARISK